MPTDRRRLLESAALIPLLSVPPAFAAGLPSTLAPTPAQTPSPFYPRSFPADSDADLLHVAGHNRAAQGVATEIAGKILDTAGHPVRGARVEIWQCDANGHYHYVGDDEGRRPLDRDFQGYGTAVTDGDGGYRFLTIRPVPYPGRTPHIHFAVAAPGFARLVTQMYVAGERLNERDPVLADIRDPAARARVIVPLRPMSGPVALAGTFDIVLA